MNKYNITEHINDGLLGACRGGQLKTVIFMIGIGTDDYNGGLILEII